MKELSIQGKATRYEQAIKVAQRFYNNSVATIKKELEDIFPELAESEDEKIRKSLSAYFAKFKPNDMWDDDFSFGDIVAWLERQGEQKPTDDVEPKFKVGDWVVNTITNNVEQIIEITSNEYICSETLIVSFDNQHLLKKWTIQDAKDGDALYLQKDGKEHIIIYKGILKERFRTFVSAYCAYNGIVDAFCFADVSRYIDIAYGGIMPATKKQHDLLFTKMKEAGYEWDAEKKELKKIEQSPAWSEEDENIRLRLIDYLYGKSRLAKDREDGISWLKFLKDRVQILPKSDWSEEDETMLKRVVDFIPQCMTAHGYNEYINWLKALKERYTWKPSDEQMRVLDLAIRCGINRGTTEETTLVSLFNDLKKLK